jgi:iron complex transport system substrate-binding protein
VYGKTAVDVPQRIVCLDPGAAALAYAVGAGARVVAVPAGAPQATVVPVLARLDTGSVLALEPDLVVVSCLTDIVRDIGGAGVPVLWTEPGSFDGVLRAMLLVGGALGCVDVAREVVQDMRDEVKQIREYSSIWPDRPRVHVELPDRATPGWVSDLIDIAGGRDVLRETPARGHPAGDSHGVEDIASHDPQIIIIAARDTALHRDALVRRPGWSGTSAVRTGEIHEVPCDDVALPGPSVMSGLRQIHEIVQAFQSSLA